MQSKQRERWLLEQFLRKERISTSIREDEAPDFRVDIDGEETGIELTELYHPSFIPDHHSKRARPWQIA